MLGSSSNLSLQAKTFYLPLDYIPYLMRVSIAFFFIFVHTFHQFIISVRVEILQRQVLQIILDPVYPQSGGQRRIYFKGFLCYESLPVRWMKIKRAHVMESVNQFYEEYPDIGGHRQYHFSEVFRLAFQLVSKGNFAYLGQTIHKKSDIFAEAVFHLLKGSQCILNGVMQKSGYQRGGVKPHFNQHPRHLQGMD